MPTTKTTFKEGDRVAIVYRGEVRRIDTVTRVTKRFVELSHGTTRYRPDGRDTYPRCRDSWAHQNIRLADDADVAAVRKANIVSKLRHFDWDKLPLETLEEVFARTG